MSVHANFYVLLDSTMATQYYSHYDGYFRGIGNDLRTLILNAISKKESTSDISLRDILLDTIHSVYEVENLFTLNSRNILSDAGPEFVYLIDPISEPEKVHLYGFYINPFGLLENKTVREVLDIIKTMGTEFDLNKKIEEN